MYLRGIAREQEQYAAAYRGSRMSISSSTVIRAPPARPGHCTGGDQFRLSGTDRVMSLQTAIGGEHAQSPPHYCYLPSYQRTVREHGDTCQVGTPESTIKTGHRLEDSVIPAAF
jgi:hypothetical protein